jgi:hypothetical protein
MSVANDVIYAVGGYNGTILGTVEAYDPATGTWATKALMPTARFGLGISAVNGVIFAVGGEDSSAPSRTVEAFTVCSYQIVSTDNAGNLGYTAPVLNPGSGALPNINSASVKQGDPDASQSHGLQRQSDDEPDARLAHRDWNCGA